MRSIKRTARITGGLYLIIAVASAFAFFVAYEGLIVPGDASATANNITASEGLFRIGFVGDSVTFLVEVVLVVLLYKLLRPVSQTLSLIAASFRLAMTVLQGTNLLNKVTALLLLNGAGYATAFEPDQLHALVSLFLSAYEYGALIWGTFFGLHLLVVGYLLYRSGYFPRILGVLFALASAGYLIDSFGNLVLPQFAEVYTWIVMATIPAELAFAVWLLIKGVNAEKWEKRSLDSA